MKAQISGGINFSMSGIPYWTMDIGGFSVEKRYENATDEDLEEWRELQTRWYQFGAFVPIFRSHGQYPFREIFNIAPEDHQAYQSMLYYDRLRYRLLPYLYTLAGMTWQNDYTIMRGLVMDFPNDTAVRNIGDQYMLGPSLLISPVYQYRARTRNLYLPEGNLWYDLYSGKSFSGGQEIQAAAPYGRMPVFVKSGSIIPLGPEIEYTRQKPADTITVNIYGGRDAEFNLYEDDGSSYEYEKGAFTTIGLKYTEATKTVSIGDRRGSFNGMLQHRIFRFRLITPDRPKSPDLRGRPDKEVFYKGKKVVVNL